MGSPAARETSCTGRSSRRSHVIDDPQALANNFFDEIDQPGVGKLRLSTSRSGSSRIRVDPVDRACSRRAYRRGARQLGYSAEQISRDEREEGGPLTGRPRQAGLQRSQDDSHSRRRQKQVLIGENLFALSDGRDGQIIVTHCKTCGDYFFPKLHVPQPELHGQGGGGQP